MALVLLVSEKEMMTVLVRVLRRDNVKGNMCSEPQKDSLLVRLKGGVDIESEGSIIHCASSRIHLTWDTVSEKMWAP